MNPHPLVEPIENIPNKARKSSTNKLLFASKNERTDSNQVNFWILYAFGYHFAPRYRDLHKKMGALVGARHPNEYSDFLIKPVRKIYRQLIEQE